MRERHVATNTESTAKIVPQQPQTYRRPAAGVVVQLNPNLLENKLLTPTLCPNSCGINWGRALRKNIKIKKKVEEINRAEPYMDVSD